MSMTDQLIKEQMEKDNKARIMNTAKRMIWVTFTKEGIHKYPAALEDPALATCLLYTSPSPRDRTRSRMPSSA